MSDFRSCLAGDEILCFDGGMGTMLQSRGLEPGVSPEEFGWNRPEAIEEVHRLYFEAGARVATTNTFGGTHFKLGGKLDARQLNERMAAAARRAADAHMAAHPGQAVWVAGSVGPTGHFVRPLGKVSFGELVAAYEEQIRGLAAGGVDLILAETHFDLQEVRAVVLAARRVSSLPVGTSMTFEDGVSLTGTTPLVFLDSMQNMGVDLVATNCSAGPEGLELVARAMLPRLRTPLLVEPNAGLPELVGEETVFRLSPGDFADQTEVFAELGAKFIGGCCGTTPDHIRALNAKLGHRNVVRPPEPDTTGIILTSRALSVPILVDRGLHALGTPCAVIGERINPTGKQRLIEELQQGEFTQALAYAREQVDSGAPVLDVNVGAPMVDETVLLPGLAETLVGRFKTPLCLDSANPEAIKAALDAYPGSPLVNSITGEPGRMEELGPLCRDYGAPFILLPLVGRKLPVTAADRIEVIEALLAQADALSIPRRLIMVDVLALTVSSKPEAARHCLETIQYCANVLKLPTVMGLSNISFGLPARELLNSTFLSMAMASGLSACIANPDSVRIREAMAASEVLLNRDPQAGTFIAEYSDWTPGGGGGGSEPKARAGGKKAATLREAVILGDKETIHELVDRELEAGKEPYALVNDTLIPAITEVGEKYERKEFFLPQLILAAETMQTAVGKLEPLLKKESEKEKKPVIVMATVEGDIHDIGKNIVILILRNHGFDVLDLGKDVPATAIADAAKETGAFLVGLSALMTTTMVKMRETVELLRERKLPTKVMVGGAVVTQAFAESIGAAGYAGDAVGAVKLAQSLLEA